MASVANTGVVGVIYGGDVGNDGNQKPETRNREKGYLLSWVRWI